MENHGSGESLIPSALLLFSRLWLVYCLGSPPPACSISSHYNCFFGLYFHIYAKCLCIDKTCSTRNSISSSSGGGRSSGGSSNISSSSNNNNPMEARLGMTGATNSLDML